MNQHAKRRAQALINRLGLNDDEEVVEIVKRPSAPIGPNAEGHFSYEMPESANSTRLDKALADYFESAQVLLSRSRIKTLIQNGHVCVNGKIAEDPAIKVHSGYILTVDVPDAAPPMPLG